MKLSERHTRNFFFYFSHTDHSPNKSQFYVSTNTWRHYCTSEQIHINKTDVKCTCREWRTNK